MKIVLAGASGFLGGALRSRLAADGHEMTQLVRREPAGQGQVRWDPHAGVVDSELLASVDVVVNVAGAPIAHWPWTDSYRRTLLDSRVNTTATLARAIAGLDDKPALVNTSAIGFYGDRGSEVLDEDSPPGEGFLADLVQEWEAAAAPAREAGARVAIYRPCIVLDGSGGILKLAKLPFQFGVGARIGSGQQYFPTVSLDDYVSVACRLIADDDLEGIFNVVSPVVATNKEFTEALGRRLHRPTFLTVPSAAVKLLGNDIAGQVLGSIRAQPRRLQDAGYEFAHPTIVDQMNAAFASDGSD
jgi:uncharacterized protein (TIGR01777 family)